MALHEVCCRKRSWLFCLSRRPCRRVLLRMILAIRMLESNEYDQARPGLPLSRSWKDFTLYITAGKFCHNSIASAHDLFPGLPYNLNVEISHSS